MKSRFSIPTFSTLAVLLSVGCVGGLAHNLPPSQRLMEPGPGVGGPGPGVIRPVSAAMPPGGGAGMASEAYYAAGCLPGGGMAGAGMGVVPTSQIAFLGVAGGEVAWDTTGQGMFDGAPLVMPGRQNFSQGAIYRMKLTNLPARPGVELYPTLEVAPVTPRTDAFLAHSPIPVQFTDEDLDQVLSGNYVTKVIYLPDPEFQELALAGVETLVSTQLDPGVDPIAEADRRGSILAILRMGNLDLQLPGQMVAGGGGVTPAQYQQGEGLVPPQGMPTSQFAPQVAPPGLVSGVNGPQYGMPITGTPIGLPGPPHIPLGHQAGLTKHVMKNRTRVMMPPPVHKMSMTVKQRPGMNYPRPVNHVSVSETNRAGFRAFGGTLAPALPTALKRLAAKIGPDDDCD